MSGCKARKQEPGQVRVAEDYKKEREQAGQLPELQRGRFPTARADGMPGKDLEATMFTIHDTSPLGREFVHQRG